LAWSVLALSPCWTSAETIVLKPEVYVRGPKVFLGDVAEIEGEASASLAGIELSTAALPGATRRLDASYVLARVKNAGVEFEQLDIEGASRVQATTLHQEVSGAMLAESLRAYIEAEMPWDPLDTEVTIAEPVGVLVVPDGGLEIAWRPNPQFRYIGSGGFSAQVYVDGQAYKSVTCRATVEPYVDVLVARRDIPRGRPIGASDVDVRKCALSSLQADAFERPEELAGYVARTTIYPGDVLTTRKVTPREVIRRNQIVSVEARVNGLLLQARARALSDACAGDVVVCENLRSKEQFQGIVLDTGTVLVP